MTVKNEEKFIKLVESLIDPDEINNILFIQKFKKLLPKTLFKKILLRTSRKNPYIGFVIEPYSLFLLFKITDIEKAKSLLPERFEMEKASIFNKDKKEFYFGIGNLNTRGSTFWGIRLESYLIARDKKTGILSWIFFDILSNTIIAMPSVGILDPNSKNAIFTSSSNGDLYLDIKDDHSNREIVLKVNISNGTIRKPDEELWVMGNTSIGHISELSTGNDDPFAVIFNPSEVAKALDIPPSDVKTVKNSLVPDFAEKHPSKVACFPFTQHYIADSPGCRTYIKSKDDLIEKYNTLTEMDIDKPFSTKGIKRVFLSSIVILPLIILAIYKWGA